MNKKNKDIFDIFQKKISFCKKYVTKISEEKLKIEFSNLNMIRKEMNKLWMVQYFLSGIFWAGGSISQNKSDLSMDLKFKNNAFIKTIINLLKKYEINTICIFKKNTEILRIKKLLSLANIFLLLNCQKEAFFIFNKSVNKEINRQINSTTNLQISNEIKSITSAQKYIKAITELKQQGIKPTSKNNQLVWASRIRYPDLTIMELTNKINTNHHLNISRATVYRSLKLAYDLNSQDKK